MPTTHYEDPAIRVATLESRTDAAGSPITDIAGAEFRLYADLLNEGVIGTDAWKVEAGTGMQVIVGSGVDGEDLVIVAGQQGGQGNYLAELSGGSHAFPVPAADLGQGRTDKIYAVVQDNAYDTSGIVKARIGYREGNLGSGSVSPDPAWEAYLELATISIAAGQTQINPSDITDERVQAALKVQIDPADIGAVTDAELAAHEASPTIHGSGPADVGADPAGSAAAVQSNLDSHAGTGNPHSDSASLSSLSDHKGGGDHDGRYYTESETDVLLAGKSDTGHDHAGTYSLTGHDHDGDYYPQATVDSKDVATTGYRQKGDEATPKDVTISDQDPSGSANDGDLWLKYQ